jgi:hypothetical protein
MTCQVETHLETTATTGGNPVSATWVFANRLVNDAANTTTLFSCTTAGAFSIPGTLAVTGASTLTGLLTPNGNIAIPSLTQQLDFLQGTAGPGTVAVSGTGVTGVSTLFTKTFRVGDNITVTTSSSAETKAITTITSDTVLVTEAFAGTAAAGTAYLITARTAASIDGRGVITAGGLNLSDTVWDDLRFPAQSINPAGSATPPTISNTTGMLEFSGSVDNVIAGAGQMPHKWKYGTTVYPHLHLLFPNTNTNNTRWKLEYNIVPLGGNAVNAYGSYSDGGTIDIPNANNARTHVLAPFSPISMAGYVGSTMIMWKISRLAASDATDNDTQIAVLMEFDLHYEVDKLGSPDAIPG